MSTSKDAQDSNNDQGFSLDKIAAGTPYTREAYGIVVAAISSPLNLHTLESLDTQKSHIDAEELCWRLHDLVIRGWGKSPKSQQQLAKWGIHSTEDFGKIVYTLIDAGAMQAREEDSLEDFQNVYAFQDHFETLKFSRPGNGWTQWRLSTLFIITTICSFAFAGAGKHGFYGAIGTLFSTWLTLIGIFCIYLGVTDRSKGWLLSITTGIGLSAAGIFGFLAVTSL